MNKLIIILFCAVACSLMGACGGGSEEDVHVPDGTGLVLSADKDTLYKSGYDKIVFTVKYDGLDVTDKSQILERASGTFVKKNEFSTTKLGEFIFTAQYNEEVSKEIVITSVEQEYYLPNLLVMHFTSTTCLNCPRMVNSIKTAQAQAPGRILKMSLHGPGTESDPMELQAYTQPLSQKYGCELMYPVAVLNGIRWWSEAGGYDDMKSFLPDRGDAGLALTTKIDGDNATIEVHVKTMKSYSKPCSIAVLLVESSLVYPQLNADGTTLPYYVHDDVVRRYLTDVMGDKLEEGELKVGKTLVKSYTYAISSLVRRENLDVIAYLIDGDKDQVQNSCRVKLGEAVDFQMVD